MILKNIFLFFAILTIIDAAGLDTQSAGVKGILFCNNKPAHNVLVKLYDEDFSPIDFDDLLDKGKTNMNGYFELQGYTDELSPIDPKLNIYHDCNDKYPCKRKITIRIPKEYISKGKYPRRHFDIGTLDLNGHHKSETRDCFY
uniref:Transthyretin-like family-containing protein n=1 Tax=Parastrongyloides trichosuri TaxID=131310 RepID=A0A0N5A6S8_PARTI